MARKSLTKLVKLVENTSSSSPIEKQFVSDLTYSIEQDAGKETRIPSKAFKPSSIGGCARNLYYQLIGEKPCSDRKESANGVGILESGTDRHERIQKAICGMKENGIDCEYVDVAEYIKQNNLNHIQVVKKQGMETKCFWEELPLSFLTDGIIIYNGEPYILEIKTMNSAKFFQSKSYRPEHESQGVCYSLAFGINKVLYLYENRDDLNKKAFLMEVSEQQKQKLLDKVEFVKECVRLRVPPEAKSKNCTYCAYKTVCKSESCET